MLTAMPFAVHALLLHAVIPCSSTAPGNDPSDIEARSCEWAAAAAEEEGEETLAPGWRRRRWISPKGSLSAGWLAAKTRKESSAFEGARRRRRAAVAETATAEEDGEEEEAGPAAGAEGTCKGAKRKEASRQKLPWAGWLTVSPWKNLGVGKTMKDERPGGARARR